MLRAKALKALKSMANERVTENLVRDKLRDFDFYDEQNDVRVEEQKSEIANVKKLLKTAGKAGKGGKGSPEFIISSASHPDFLIVIECKGDVKKHQSLAHDDPVGYAVDGALHYARSLSKDFNVIAVAVSGQTASQLKVSTFLHSKGSSLPKVLKAKDGAEISEIIPWKDYIEHATFDPEVQRLRFAELMAFSRELHDFMRDHMKLIESEKPLIVSGTLIALRDTAFAKSFGDYSPEDLQRQWAHVIKGQIEKADIPNAKKLNMMQPYASIAVHPELGQPAGKTALKYPKGVLHELIDRLSEKVWPFITYYQAFDVVGQFYGEFLKYTGGDKKALGIVLTPRHITELFARLANVNKDSRVLDICAGTAGFLVSAMHEMMKTATTDAQRRKIKQSGLVGVEQQPNMYALAASNMILRGDGKANLHQGSCFEESIIDAVKKHKCDVGLLNPPYSQGDEDLHELEFVKHMLNQLTKGGTGIAIVPISCAISPHPLKEELLKHHTLEAVMSMPQDVFHPVGVVTCLMVFTAHKPHASSNKKSWFGYWRNDGFVKTKHLGRTDLNERWSAISERWVSQFRNREEHAGECVKRLVGPQDEWCAEAYMETDYATLTAEELEREIRKYVVFSILNDGAVTAEDEQEDTDDIAA